MDILGISYFDILIHIHSITIAYPYVGQLPTLSLKQNSSSIPACFEIPSRLVGCISLLLLFFIDPGRTGRLVPQVRRWACCTRAAHHGVNLSCIKHKFLDAQTGSQACRRHAKCVFAALTEGKALVNVPRFSQQTQTYWCVSVIESVPAAANIKPSTTEQASRPCQCMQIEQIPF